jgi:hypothetical protein
MSQDMTAESRTPVKEALRLRSTITVEILKKGK